MYRYELTEDQERYIQLERELERTVEEHMARQRAMSRYYHELADDYDDLKEDYEALKARLNRIAEICDGLWDHSRRVPMVNIGPALEAIPEIARIARGEEPENEQ